MAAPGISPNEFLVAMVAAVVIMVLQDLQLNHPKTVQNLEIVSHNMEILEIVPETPQVMDLQVVEDREKILIATVKLLKMVMMED